MGAGLIPSKWGKFHKRNLKSLPESSRTQGARIFDVFEFFDLPGAK